MLPWKFSVYVSESGRSVQADIDRLSDYGLEYFKRQVTYLASAPRLHWDEPHALKISGHRELYEIRFKDQHNATRALGFFGPTPGTFTITVLATHKGHVYTPRDAFDTAGKRRLAVCAGRAASAPLQVDGEDFPPIPD